MWWREFTKSRMGAALWLSCQAARALKRPTDGYGNRPVRMAGRNPDDLARRQAGWRTARCANAGRYEPRIWQMRPDPNRPRDARARQDVPGRGVPLGDHLNRMHRNYSRAHDVFPRVVDDDSGLGFQLRLPSRRMAGPWK